MSTIISNQYKFILIPGYNNSLFIQIINLNTFERYSIVQNYYKKIFFSMEYYNLASMCFLQIKDYNYQIAYSNCKKRLKLYFTYKNKILFVKKFTSNILSKNKLLCENCNKYFAKTYYHYHSNKFCVKNDTVNTENTIQNHTEKSDKSNLKYNLEIINEFDDIIKDMKTDLTNLNFIEKSLGSFQNEIKDFGSEVFNLKQKLNLF